MEETNKPQESSGNQNQGQGSQSGQQGGNSGNQQGQSQSNNNLDRGPLRDGFERRDANPDYERKSR